MKLSLTTIIYRQILGLVVSFKIKRVGKSIVAHFKALSCHLSGNTEEIDGSLNRDSWCPGQHSKQATPEFQSTYSVGTCQLIRRLRMDTAVQTE
jgi:hypothetical protein